MRVPRRTIYAQCRSGPRPFDLWMAQIRMLENEDGASLTTAGQRQMAATRKEMR